MEIRGISTSIIKNYPKSDEITKKDIKKSFLSKWKTIGLTYAVVNLLLPRIAYSESLDYATMVSSGVQQEIRNGIIIGGMEIPISEEIQEIMRVIWGVSGVSWIIAFGIVALYLMIGLIYCGVTKKKLTFDKKLKKIILIGIIAFLIFLLMHFIEVHIGSI